MAPYVNHPTGIDASWSLMRSSGAHCASYCTVCLSFRPVHVWGRRIFGWHHLSNRSSSSDVQLNCNTANCESHVLTCANLGDNQKLHIFSYKFRFGKIFWILTDFWNSMHSGGCPLFRLNRTWSFGAGSVDHLAGLHHGGHLGAGKALHRWVLRSHAIWWQSAHHVPWDQEEAGRHHPVPEFCSGDLLRWIPIPGTSSRSRPYPH